MTIVEQKPITVGEVVDIKSGPFEGKSGVVQSWNSSKNEITIEISCFKHRIPLTMSVTSLQEGAYLSGSKNPISEDYSFIRRSLETLDALRAYEFRFSHGYDFQIVSNYIWFNGWHPAGNPYQDTNLNIEYHINVFVVKLPLLVIKTETLSRLNGRPESVPQAELKKVWSKEYKSFNFDMNMFYRQEPQIDGFRSTPFFDCAVGKILDNELIQDFKDNQLIPFTLVFKPAAKISPDHLILPLIPVKLYMRQNFVLFDWGLFHDKLNVVPI